MTQVQSWISLKYQWRSFVLSLSLRLYKYGSIPVRFVASSSCDSVAWRVQLLPFPPFPPWTLSFWVIGQIGYVRFWCRVRIFCPKAFFIFELAIFDAIFAAFFSTRRREEAAEEEADIMKCKRLSDRSGSAQFGWLRFECSLSAMECAYNGSPLS